MSKRKLRLLLGDQLNEHHRWFGKIDDDVIYLIAELGQETSYVRHHIQKVCAFFDAMGRFAAKLQSFGHSVDYLTLDETCSYRDLPDLIRAKLDQYACESFEYLQPDEYRLDQQLQGLCSELKISTQCSSCEHFFLEKGELSTFLQSGKHNRMESFYRKMRKRFDVLMEGDMPLGGKWNYDESNRNSFKKSDLASIPEPLVFGNDVQQIVDRLERHNVATFGRVAEKIVWPTDREQATCLLQFFCDVCLPRFGQFQDAMTEHSPHAWSLYHSRLSFALNVKLLSPHEVIDTAVAAYYENPQTIDLAQVEGFIRQILGWREYIRGVYWINMPDYSEQNSLAASKELPNWFWDGNTKMSCLKHAIGQSLDYAYAHHIQRLMITGNFALLTGIAPAQVDAWYLGIYVDAIEWVELPNTRGMALFADGGWIATKPYAASGNYINKMSDYCRSCHYKVKEKVSDDACPFNSLYWNFIDQHMASFQHNPRLSFVVRQWLNKPEHEKRILTEHAQKLLGNLNSL